MELNKKYPRTYHLPFSPGTTSDDKKLGADWFKDYEGKEVIISCSKERYTHKYESEDEKKYERYLRPHFDIAQKQLLIWDDYDDLSKKICEWIVKRNIMDII